MKYRILIFLYIFLFMSSYADEIDDVNLLLIEEFDNEDTKVHSLYFLPLDGGMPIDIYNVTAYNRKSFIENNGVCTTTALTFSIVKLNESQWRLTDDALDRIEHGYLASLQNLENNCFNLDTKDIVYISTAIDQNKLKLSLLNEELLIDAIVECAQNNYPNFPVPAFSNGVTNIGLEFDFETNIFTYYAFFNQNQRGHRLDYDFVEKQLVPYGCSYWVD